MGLFPGDSRQLFPRIARRKVQPAPSQAGTPVSLYGALSRNTEETCLLFSDIGT